MNKKKTCANCKHFEKITKPKMGWLQRMEFAEKNYPDLKTEVLNAWVNHGEDWEQEDSGYGFCYSNDHLHEIESKIPDYISCKYFEKKT